MKISTTQLNRAKIKDLMVAIREEINPNNGLGLYRIEQLSHLEESALAQATDDDLRRIEQLFIRHKLGIEYFPSQNKKKIEINGEFKIVPIDTKYG